MAFMASRRKLVERSGAASTWKTYSPSIIILLYLTHRHDPFRSVARSYMQWLSQQREHGTLSNQYVNVQAPQPNSTYNYSDVLSLSSQAVFKDVLFANPSLLDFLAPAAVKVPSFPSVAYQERF